MFYMKAAKNEFHEFTSEGQTFFFLLLYFWDLYEIIDWLSEGMIFPLILAPATTPKERNSHKPEADRRGFHQSYR